MVNAAVNPNLLSKAPNGNNGNGASQNISVSADGRYVVFDSFATNLVSGLTDTNNASDIFLRDTQTGTIRCLSGNSPVNPTSTGNQSSATPIISPDGRYVVFASLATDLVGGIDLNDRLDVFRFDTILNQRALVSVNALGTGTGNNGSGDGVGWHPYDMSADGRYIAFMSVASDLLGFITDTNAKSDIFIRDMQTGFTRLASINSITGTSTGNNESVDPSLSADGLLVAFTSKATDLIPIIDNNNDYDVFVYKVPTQATKCASLSRGTNVTGVSASSNAVISKNGVRVAFWSVANNLTFTVYYSPWANIYVYDTGLNQSSVVSINTAGTESGNNETGTGGQNTSLSISADGRYITFESKAGNINPLTGSGTYNLFRRDLFEGRTDLVSSNTAGSQGGDAHSRNGQKGGGMSSDGRFIVFESGATNLTSDFPGTSLGQVYVRDMLNGITTALTLNSAATALGNGASSFPRISANGRTVVLESDATDLTPANANPTHNVFQAFVPTPQRAVSDFDGDGFSDFAVYRPGQGAWYVLNNQRTFASYRLYGNATDTIVPADYNGDGRTDYAVFRPSTGTWYISDGLSFGETVTQFGQAGDKPIPQDYDGDSKADLAVYRTGIWYLIGSQTGQLAIYQFGLAGDIPVPGDFDGDGKADLAVFRPADGNWYIRKSSNAGLQTAHFGQNGDRPVPADFDGDGKTDLAVYRSGTWWILNTRNNSVVGASWGLASDIPVAGTYDGDGKADIAVFRPSDGNWYVMRSTSTDLLAIHFGQNGDVPIASAFIP
ncbi:MAG: FG-GAP-like repeat-containing protein [Pyrinomonadaceae bacterium]